VLMLFAPAVWANDTGDKTQAQQIEELRAMVLRLQSRVDGLEQQLNAQQLNERQLNEPHNVEVPAAVPVARPQMMTVSLSPNEPAAASNTTAVSANVPPPPPTPVQPVRQTPAPQSEPQTSTSPLASVLPANLPGGATLNYLFDGYYEFNFNQPPGRVNYLRAYDVLSNVFSINQADIVLDLDPDVSKGRRYGVRVDLQFGQATDTLQGNPANEPRPGIYQNIFQAFGTYVVPLGSGLDVDFGKWASSLGAEGNYSKDQINYTRSMTRSRRTTGS
jgi:Putative beta-barrel porin-2, OmpL-like. bbp2